MIEKLKFAAAALFFMALFAAAAWLMLMGPA